ncbi:MAG: winged helix DNA-binding domain-containing protein [Microcella sp.]|uniref:DNA glycosylase AlkZ-like family protein n=1 Tax=Microcella sp. TaxID=1913979 RepID=UPI0024CCC38C|nr:crosslink repair DNA glycosylase YcaQ family protein [Microcella sp.]UYN83490.1 MAG: winged helix DNA-binding domain-containing protein [Microcella sp.]
MTAALRLSLDEARRIAVRAAQLDYDADAGSIDDVVRSLAMIRVELTTIVMPAADHVLYSRLGDEVRLGDAERALAMGRVWERIWMLRPLSHVGLFTAGMRTWLDRSGARGWVEANAEFRQSILNRIADLGPLTSADIPDEAVAPWPSTGWTNDRNVTQMLECLHGAGELAVVGRAGRYRVWDLAERVLPPAAEVPRDEAARVRSEHLLAACGIMRDSIAVSPRELHGVVPVGEPAVIDGVPGRWRVDPAQLDRDFSGRTVLLSPFDRLMTDKQRQMRLFDFDYGVEMYKPERLRRRGPFAMPILHGERLIGSVDARADRRAGTLTVHGLIEDVPFTTSMRDAVDHELLDLARWLRLDLKVTMTGARR